MLGPLVRALRCATGRASLLCLSFALVEAPACARSKTSAATTREAAPVLLVTKILRVYPHDREAFTQGLLYFDGRLYESTGLRGRSSVRQVELESGRVERSTPLDTALFGEGLARVGAELVQLTWQEGRALVWDLSALKPMRQHDYQGEGWGLCFDGQRLVMSDGSDRLRFRDPRTFAITGERAVTRAGQPVRALNELECVDGAIYANIWQDDHIARIDPASGRVTAWIDASGLLPREERGSVDVLNGIAYRADRGTFLLTGKLWPRLYEVTFVPASGAPPASAAGASSSPSVR